MIPKNYDRRMESAPGLRKIKRMGAILRANIKA
jgi:hypothetical protein